MDGLQGLAGRGSTLKVLIYGHSQAQPTGLADDMVKALGKLKVKVTRVGIAGKNDGQLLSLLDNRVGDISGYDRILLYGYGNSSTRPQTHKLLTHLGKSRTVLVIPPINLDREGVGPPEPRLEAQKRRLRELPEEFGVPVFGIWGYRKDFRQDQIHMRPGTAPGKVLVEDLLVAIGLKQRAGLPPFVVAAVAAVLAFGAWRLSRR